MFGGRFGVVLDVRDAPVLEAVGVEDKDMVEICLQLRLEGQSPTGHVRVASGVGRDFAGWVGLVAAIDELLAAAEADSTARSSGRA
jgi:hypothetical protein